MGLMSGLTYLWIGVDVDDFDLSGLWLRKSTILCTMGNFEEAKECAEKSIQILETPLGFFRLGIALYCLGEFDRALSMMLEANDEDSGNVHIQHGLQVIIIIIIIIIMDR